MDENLLIQSAKKGNLDAFNELVLAYQDLVYHRALMLMGEPESAEDAAQEAFLAGPSKPGWCASSPMPVTMSCAGGRTARLSLWSR
jgi:DNA-directed RNA polymerase specialized sigma24 family protein